MNPNPLLKKLGLTTNDRAVIFHADDIGVCQASVAAYVDLLETGLLSSAAAMVPCPWFPAVAKICREAREELPVDVGVHLTLTSEWTSYRWGPISTVDPATGLIDEEGYFHRDCAFMQGRAEIAAVQRELTAQIDRALAAGIDVTHIDSHMGALFHPRFLPPYFGLAKTYRVPPLMLRPEAITDHVDTLVDGDLINSSMASLAETGADGIPLLDGLEMMPLDTTERRLDEAIERLGQLPVGISYFIIHPAKDTPELRAFASDWECRVADYELFMSDAWRKAVERSGVKVTGWRDLRDLYRSA